MAGLFAAIGSAISGPVETVLETRKLKKEAEMELLKKKIDGTVSWETTVAGQMDKTWKDEYLVVLFTVPFILCFVPGMEGIVQHGFDQIAKTPEWYRYLVFMLVSASVGIRGLPKLLKGFK